MPTAEALEDVLPDILRAEFDLWLPHADLREQIIAGEEQLRLDAAAQLADLLNSDSDE